MKQKLKSQTKLMRLIIMLVFFMIAAILLYFITYKIFTLKTIELDAQGIKLQIEKNRLPNNLLFFPLDKIRLQLLQNYPLIEDLTITKIYPNKIKIYANKRIAVAVVKNGMQKIFIDKNAIIIGQSEDERELPVLYFDIKVQSVGQKIVNNQINLSLEFIQKTKDFLKVSSITEKDGQSILVKTENISIFFPQEKNIEKIATLQTLVNGFKIKGTLPQVVDLRYDKPVIYN